MFLCLESRVAFQVVQGMSKKGGGHLGMPALGLSMAAVLPEILVRLLDGLGGMVLAK